VHLLSCGGMLFMLLAPHAGGTAMTAAGTGGAGAVAWPPLTVMLAVAITASVVVAAERFPAPAPARAGPVIGPRLRTSCRSR
jgi:hypothetical protein